MKIIKKVGERLPPWLSSEIRPVLTFTGSGVALIHGSVELAARGWQWLGDRLSTWERLGAIAAGGYLAVYGCWHAPHIARFAVPSTVVAWCVAAWWTAPNPAPAESEAAESSDTSAEQPLTLIEFTDLVRRVAGPRQGAHLADLLAQAELEGWTQAELKDTAIVDFGLPVEEFKLIIDGRQRVRDGVRVRHLPPAPATPPPAALTGPAPQPLSDASQNPR